MENIRAVYFDAVGTLIHPEPSAARIYADTGRRFGSGYTQDQIARRFGRAFDRQEAIDRANGWKTSEARELERWQDIVREVLDDVADAGGCFEVLYAHFARVDSWRYESQAEALLLELGSRG